MERSNTPVDDFLASLDDGVRETMAAVDAVLAAALEGRARTLWEGVFWGGTEQTIIGYGDIVQPRPRGADVDWFLIGLARQQRHYSIYVNAAEDGAYLGQAYADRLGKVKAGSASLTFTKLEHLDLDVLAELAVHAARLVDAS